MTRKRNDPLDILTPMDEQPSELTQAPEMVDEPIVEPTIDTGTRTMSASELMPPQHTGRPIDLLESAANILLSQFPSSTRDFIIEVADIVLKIPRWELIAGSVLAQFSQGTLASPDLDPSWRDPVISEARGVCEYCHKEFIPKRYNQRFCSNECGGKRRKEELDKKLEDEAVRFRQRVLSYISSMKDEIVKQGGQPKQIVLAANVYRQIGPALQDRNVVLGLKIKVDDGAPDDRIYIVP